MMRINAWPGVRLLWISRPTARALTRIDERLDDRQCDIGFEQRHAHLAQRIGDVLFGQTAAAAQALDDP